MPKPLVDSHSLPFSPRVREKLLVAGLSEAELNVNALLARMPDFDTRLLQDLSADAVAEVFLYLAAKGVVTVPRPSDKALLDMPWGSHVCQFYNGKEDLVEMLVPYFKQGLERNEVCAWLVGDLTVQEAKSALQAAVPDLDEYIARGQMHIRHFSELYTDAKGDVKPADQLSEEFVAMEAAVKSGGFSGLRASGSVSWISDENNMWRFMEYETKVNLAIQDARIMAVCTYPAQAAKLCACKELIHNHGNVFVKRGHWVMDKSEDARKIEALFASLAGEPSPLGDVALA